jgi:hypothetical protein
VILGVPESYSGQRALLLTNGTKLEHNGTKNKQNGTKNNQNGTKN